MRDLINKIDKKAHYFTLLHPLEGVIIPGMGLSITYTSSNTREKWVECEIVEDRHKVEDGYKVDLQSVEPGYGRDSFYLDTFLSFLEKGLIVKKTPNMKCVEVEWREPLTPGTELVHRAYTLQEITETPKQMKKRKNEIRKNPQKD